MGDTPEPPEPNPPFPHPQGNPADPPPNGEADGLRMSDQQRAAGIKEHILLCNKTEQGF